MELLEIKMENNYNKDSTRRKKKAIRNFRKNTYLRKKTSVSSVNNIYMITYTNIIYELVKNNYITSSVLVNSKML